MKTETKEQILKKSMSKPYCGETYFDFLDEEEKPLIYKAMQEFTENIGKDLIKLCEIKISKRLVVSDIKDIFKNKGINL